MTIDEAENYLIALKHCETCEASDTNICKSCPHYRRGSSAKCYDAIDVAIDTMRKYQMIKEITDNWVLLPDSTVLDFKDVRTIKEIIDNLLSDKGDAE